MSTTLHSERHFSFLNLCLMLISWCLGVKTDFINFNPLIDIQFGAIDWLKSTLRSDELINFFKAKILQIFLLFSLAINSWWLWDILHLNKPFKCLLLWLMFSERDLHNCHDMLMTGGIQNSVIYLNLLLQSDDACETKKSQSFQ